MIAEPASSVIREILGEAIHTAFRKAADSDQATTIWKEIGNLPDGEWSAILDFVADGIMPVFSQVIREDLISELRAKFGVTNRAAAFIAQGKS